MNRIAALACFSVLFFLAPPAPAQDAPEGVVELLQDGDEPRRALRYAVGAGAAGGVLLVSNFGMNITVNGQDQSPEPIPGQQVRMDLAIAEVERDGDIRFNMVVDEASAVESEDFDPAILEVISNAMRPLEGATVEGVVSPRGLNRDVAVQEAPEGDPQLAQMLADLEQIATQVSTPLPSEPIGVGARWSVSRELSIGAFSISQTTTFEALSIEDNEVRVAMAVEQTAEQQPITSPTLPPNAEARLSAYRGTGEGEAVIDLNRLAPIERDLETVSSWTVDVAMGEQEQSIQYSMTMSVHIEATSGE